MFIKWRILIRIWPQDFVKSGQDPTKTLKLQQQNLFFPETVIYKLHFWSASLFMI